MIALFWQHNNRASLQGDNPQTPYDGLQRSYKSIDGDGSWKPCADAGKKLSGQAPRPRHPVTHPRSSA